LVVCSLVPAAFARIVASGAVKLAFDDSPTLLREVNQLHAQVHTRYVVGGVREDTETAHANTPSPHCGSKGWCQSVRERLSVLGYKRTVVRV
jgi:hypothetical protein